MQELVSEIFTKMFTFDSIWSIVLRGGMWFAIAVVIIISADTVNPDQAGSKLKANLGFFLIFTVLTGGLIYLLFGFAPQQA